MFTKEQIIKYLGNEVIVTSLKKDSEVFSESMKKAAKELNK